MRMWMIPPYLMCDKHILGEHGEIHKHKHNFVKKHNMGGRLASPSQIDPVNMESRHDELVEEMIRRHMNHYSPFEQPDVSYLFNGDPYSYTIDINLKHNLNDLANRCEHCRERIMNSEYSIYLEEL